MKQSVFLIILMSIFNNTCDNSFTIKEIDLPILLDECVEVDSFKLYAQKVFYQTGKFPKDGESVIYQAQRKNLLQWDTLLTSLPGIVKRFISIDNNYFVLIKSSNPQEGFSFYKNDKEKWTKLFSWHESQMSVINMHFINNLTGYVIFRLYKGTSILYETINGGKSWKKFLLPDDIKKSILYKNKLFLLHYMAGEKTKISIIDIPSKKITSYIIDFWAWDFAVTENLNFYLIGIKQGQKGLYYYSPMHNELNIITKMPTNNPYFHKVYIII